MKYAILLTAWCCLCFSACKKDSGTSTPAPVKEFKATVAIEGGTPFAFKANGDKASIGTNVAANGDILTGASGEFNNARLQLTLINITTEGDHIFQVNYTPGSQSCYCDYTVGNPFSPTAFYSSTSANGSGMVTIDSLSSTYISGHFSATCADGTKLVQVTSGNFEGHF